MPAWARAKAPTQIEIIRAPRTWARRSAASTAGSSGALWGRYPGTTTVSARDKRRRPPAGLIVNPAVVRTGDVGPQSRVRYGAGEKTSMGMARSEEHTSELQSRQYLVCRLLLEKKKKKTYAHKH